MTDNHTEALTAAHIRKAVKRLKEIDAMAAKTVYGGFIGVGNIWAGTRPSATQPIPTVPGVFQAVENQVKRFKRVVITKEALAAKHDKYLADVNSEMDQLESSEAFRAWRTKAVASAMKRHYYRFLQSPEFAKVAIKAVNEVIKSGN